MALIGSLVEDPTLAPPPEETPPPPVEMIGEPVAQDVPPPQPAAAPPVEMIGEPVESAPAGPPPPAQGPGLLQGVTDALGGVGNAISQAAPEPVRNVIDAVGQPIGGISDALARGGSELASDGIGGIWPAAEQVIGGIAGGPFTRMQEAAGARVAEGKTAAPSNDMAGLQETLRDPGQLLTLLPDAVLNDPSIFPDQGIDEWAAANPDEVARLQAEGGDANILAGFRESQGADDTPPSYLSNPVDAATSANPAEKVGQFLGAVPASVGGILGEVGQSIQGGELTPFLKNQAVQAAMDPLTFADPAIGLATKPVLKAAGAGLRRLPGVGKALEMAPDAARQLTNEQRAAAIGEYNRAFGQAEIPEPTLSPEIPAAPVTPGPAVLSPVNGRQVASPDLGQPVAAASPNQVIEIPGADAFTPPRYEGRVNGRLVGMFDTPELAQAELGRLDTLRVPARDAATRVGFATAPPPLREAVEQAITGEPRHRIVRGTVVSDEAKRLLDERIDGTIKFANGERPRGMTFGELVDQTNRDFDDWLAGMDLQGRVKPDAATREWDRLNKRFNPNGDVDLTALRRGDVDTPERQMARAQFLDEHFTQAIDAGNPPVARKNRALRTWDTYTNGLRQAMIYNWLNAPRYISQNLTTNSINIMRRGGGLRPALDVFTDLGEWGRSFRHQRSPSTLTSAHARMRAMGVGDYPNVHMSQQPYFDRLTGPRPKWVRPVEASLKAAKMLISPDIIQHAMSTPDQLGRIHVFNHAVDDGFRALNNTLDARVRTVLRNNHVSNIPDAKVRQVIRDLTEARRTLSDPNTNRPYTSMLGRPKKGVAIWQADDFVNELKVRLKEDVITSPTGNYDGAIDRLRRDLKNEVRTIARDADATTDSALFSWRNTNADQILGRGVLFHYWMTRQGGFYVSEALKHPWVAASYGRAMEDLQQQAEELGQPKYMSGFFQFLNSPGGVSLWYSPMDFVQSFFTFQDWQYGEEDNPFNDLTALGKTANSIPFLLHPMIMGVAYDMGLLGPDFRPPNVLGLDTFVGKTADLINLGNATDAPWMKPFNAMGIGVDDAGNKVAVPVKPLGQLMAQFGNAVSTALEPITGLSPVEVQDAALNVNRNIYTIGQQETRTLHPDWEEHDVTTFVNEKMMDADSREYGDWYEQAAQMPFQMGEGVPQPIAGLLRAASPLRIMNMPEQTAIDRTKGVLPPSGDVALRPSEEEIGSDAYYESALNATHTPEGRELVSQDVEYNALIPPSLKESASLAKAIRGTKAGGPYLDTLTEDVTVGDTTYTPDDIAAMDYDQRQGLAEALLGDKGYTWDDVYGADAAKDEYLAAHPDYAQYKAYERMTYDAADTPGGLEQFVMETAAQNPSFNGYVRSQMMDHITGEIDYSKAHYPDAYLAAQGVRPSVYSSMVGNEPTTVPGGYPAISGVPAGQPILPQMQVAQDTPMYSNPAHPSQIEKYGGGYVDDVKVADPRIATIGPGTPMQVLGDPDNYGMVKVAIGEHVGYVSQDAMQNASPAQSGVPAGTAPGPVQPTGGLAGLAGGVTNALGGAKDAVLGSIPEFAGNDSRAPTDTETTPPETTGEAAEIPPKAAGYAGAIDTTTYVSPNRSARPAPPQGIVYHYTVGDLDSFTADFMGETGRQASANYVVDRDGTIYQFVDPDDAAWTHGDVNQPDAAAQSMIDAGGGDPNMSAIGIEIVNSGDLHGDFEPYTEEQLQALEWLTADLSQRYGIPADRNHLLGHSDINTIDKRDPGPLFPYDRMIAAAAGVTPA